MKLAAALAAVVMLVACTESDSRSAWTAAPTMPRSRIEISPLEGRPSAVAVGGGALWVADDERGVVLRLDERTGRQLGAPITVSPHPIAVDISDRRVWVADRDGTITRIDMASAAVASPPIELGGHVVDLIVDGPLVWVGDIETDTVQSLAEESGAVGERVPVTEGVVRLAAAPSGVWVTNRDHTITKIDRVTLSAGAPVSVGAAPIGATVDQDVLWVANSDDGTVSRLSAEDGEPLGPAVAVSGAPIAIVLSGADAWVVQQDGHTISRLEAATGAVVERDTGVHMRPRAAALSSAGVWVVGIDPSAAALVTKPGA